MTRGPLTPVTVLYVTRGCDVSELGGILNKNQLVNYEVSLIFKQLQVRSSSSQVNNSDSKEKMKSVRKNIVRHLVIAICKNYFITRILAQLHFLYRSFGINKGLHHRGYEFF